MQQNDNFQVIPSSQGIRKRVNEKNPDAPPLLNTLWDLLKLYSHYLVLILFLALSVVAIQHFFQSTYKAKAVLLVQRAENSPLQAMMAKVTANPLLSDRRSNEYLEKYLMFLNSREFFNEVARKALKNSAFIQDFDLPSREKKLTLKTWIDSIIYSKIPEVSTEEADVENLSRMFSSMIRFLKTGMDNISVQVKSKNYTQAVKVANFIAEAAVNSITYGELQELTEARTFISNQIQLTIEKLQGLDNDVVSYKKNSDIAKTEIVGKELLERLSGTRAQLESAELKLSQNKKLISLLSDELKSQEKVLFQEGAKNLKSSQLVQTLRQNIQDIKYRKTLLLAQGYPENSPELLEINRNIDSVATRLKEAIRKEGGKDDDLATIIYDKESVIGTINNLKIENQYLQASLDSLRLSLTETLKPINQIPEAQQRLQTFHRTAQIEYSLLQEMRKRVLEIELEKVALNTKVRVLEKATIAGIPDRLNIVPKFFLASIITTIIFAIIIYILEELNRTVKSRFHVEQLGVSLIGSIPTVHQKKGIQKLLKFFSSRKNNVTDVLAPWLKDDESAEVMAFKHVRNAVLKMRSLEDKPAKIFAILGPRQSDGKSFVSCNMALSLSQLGMKTLLIDGDLRKSTVAQKLGLSTSLGLSSILKENKSLDEVLVRDIVPNCDIITSGPRLIKGASELLSGRGFSTLLDSLRKSYDYIIIDTPAVLPVVDSLIIANLADSVILTVSHRQTKVSDIEQALHKFHQVNRKPLFAVYNRVEAVGEYVYITSDYVQNTPSKKLDLKAEVSKMREALKQAKDQRPLVEDSHA